MEISRIVKREGDAITVDGKSMLGGQVRSLSNGSIKFVGKDIVVDNCLEVGNSHYSVPIDQLEEGVEYSFTLKSWSKK